MPTALRKIRIASLERTLPSLTLMLISEFYELLFAERVNAQEDNIVNPDCQVLFGGFS